MIEMFKEYLSWVKENENFYLEIKEHNLSLYDRFMPVYEVLTHIYSGIENKTMEKDDDLEKIFSVGFEYIHDQFEMCKIYLTTYFHDDFHLFMDYDEVFSILLYIEDVRYEFAEKKFKVNEKMLNDLIDEVESIVQEQKPIPENFMLYVDDVIKSLIGDQAFDFYGIIDIFIDVAETLGLYLYEEEDITIGKDI